MRPPIIVAALIAAALWLINAPPARAVGVSAKVSESGSDPDAVGPARTAAPDSNDNRSAESRPYRNRIEELSAQHTARGASLTIRLQQPLARRFGVAPLHTLLRSVLPGRFAHVRAVSS